MIVYYYISYNNICFVSFLNLIVCKLLLTPNVVEAGDVVDSDRENKDNWKQ